MTTERKEIMKITDREQAYKQIDQFEGWDNRRKNDEKCHWRRLHEPETIKKNPSKGNRGGKLNNVKENDILEKTMEEIQVLKENYMKKYIEKKEKIEELIRKKAEEIKKNIEQIEKLKKELEEINKKIT